MRKKYNQKIIEEDHERLIINLDTNYQYQPLSKNWISNLLSEFCVARYCSVAFWKNYTIGSFFNMKDLSTPFPISTLFPRLCTSGDCEKKFDGRTTKTFEGKKKGIDFSKIINGLPRHLFFLLLKMMPTVRKNDELWIKESQNISQWYPTINESNEPFFY